MNNAKRIALAGLVLFAPMLGITDSHENDCDHGKNHTIQVREGPDGKPILKYKGQPADAVHVCLGDTVRWVLTGPNREYFVDFFSGAPFPGAKKRNSSAGVISVVIGGPAERGKGYDYDTEFVDGEAMDPRIVVD